MTAYNSLVHMQSISDRILSQSPIVCLHQRRQLLRSNVRIKLIVTRDESLMELQCDL